MLMWCADAPLERSLERVGREEWSLVSLSLAPTGRG